MENSDLWVEKWINEQGKGKEAEIPGILPCTPRKLRAELPAGILGSQFQQQSLEAALRLLELHLMQLQCWE